MNDQTSRIERLRTELEAAFRNRGDLYRLMYETLSNELGADKAEQLLAISIEERGREVARAAFSSFGPDDARAIGEAFLKVSPDDGQMYPANVTRFDEGIEFKVRRCPLKDAWVEAGLDEERVSTLCRIASAFDRGLFEQTGIRFENWTWKPGDGPGCCRIRLTNQT
ncbi:MAG: L-2-amino-thiazoline-4-carboxylic acid hydrolase [Mesorhizobium sp.]